MNLFEFSRQNIFNKIFKHFVFDVSGTSRKAAKNDFEISVQIIVYFWSDHHVTRNQNWICSGLATVWILLPIEEVSREREIKEREKWVRISKSKSRLCAESKKKSYFDFLECCDWNAPSKSQECWYWDPIFQRHHAN